MMKMTKLISTVAAIALLGSSALYAASPGEMKVQFDGSNNTWAGEDAMENFTKGGSPDGDNNTVFGWAAGQRTNEEAGANTFVGSGAGTYNTNGSGNTFLGDYTGADNETGNKNTYLGAGAGSESTGSGNVFLGYDAGANEHGDDKLYISNSDTETPLIKGDFNSSMLTVNGALDVNGTIVATVESNNSVGDGLTKVMVLDANNTNTAKQSDAAFTLRNGRTGTQWNFRTTGGGNGFAATKEGTGGVEFKVVNKTGDINGTTLTVGGIVIFEDGQLVNAELEARIKALEDAAK